MDSPRKSRKRKAEHELSTNPHTVKARKREKSMQGIELAIEKAKRADQAAITYALKKLKKTDKWESASEAERAEMKKASAATVTHKRFASTSFSYQSLY
jgi:predicted MarR family transcription regulator